MRNLTRARAAVLDAPNRWPRLALLIDAMKRAGIFAEAARPVGWALCLAPNDPVALRVAAVHARANGDVRRSLDLLHRQIARDRFDLNALNSLALSLDRAGEAAASLDAHCRSAALPDWPDDQLAELCRKLDHAGRHGDARRAVRRRLSLRPDRAELALLLADRWDDGASDVEIERWYRRAFVLEPRGRTTVFDWCRFRGIERRDLDGPARLGADPQVVSTAADVLALFACFRDFARTGLDDGLVERFRALGHLETFIAGVRALSTAAEIDTALAALGNHGVPPPAGFAAGPVPPLGDGVVLVASCDRTYFDRYAAAIREASADVGGVAAVYFHVIDGPPDTSALDRTPGPPVALSHERYTGGGLAAYSAVARFLVLPALLRRYRRDVVVIDCDAVPGTDPRRIIDYLAEQDADAGLMLRDLSVPWHVPLASLSAFRATERGRAFADGLAATAGAAIARHPSWMTDQASLISWLAYAERHRLGLRVANLAEHPETDRLHESVWGIAKWYRTERTGMDRAGQSAAQSPSATRRSSSSRSRLRSVPQR